MIIARRAGARSCAPVFWCCYSVAGALPAAVSVPAPLGKPPKAKKTTASTSTKAAEAITELIDATTKIKSKKVKKATSKKRSREEPVAFCVNTSESAINSKKEMGVNSDAANVKPTTHAVAVQTTCSHSMVENSVSATNGLALSEDVRGKRSTCTKWRHCKAGRSMFCTYGFVPAYRCKENCADPRGLDAAAVRVVLRATQIITAQALPETVLSRHPTVFRAGTLWRMVPSLSGVTVIRRTTLRIY